MSISYLHAIKITLKKQNTMTQEKTKLQEAREIFGDDVVSFVRSVVSLADPDGAYIQFQDMDMEEHAECVEFLYFED